MRRLRTFNFTQEKLKTKKQGVVRQPTLTTLKICVFFKLNFTYKRDLVSNKGFRLTDKAILLYLAYVIKQYVPAADSDLQISVFFRLKLGGS